MNSVELTAQLGDLIAELAGIRQAGATWGQLDWEDTMPQLRALDDLARASLALGYSAENLEQEYDRRYGNYQTYQAQVFNEPDMARKYQQWSDETRDNALTALKVAHLQMQDFDTEEDTINTLQGMTNSAAGQMEAIQAGNMISVQLTRQLQKLRQLLMTSVQMHADYLAAKQDEQAIQWSQVNRMVNPIVDFQPQQGPRY